MAAANESDVLFVARIERGEEAAWRELIARFEGRLLAFVEGRAARRSAAEDIVQETFLGFLTSLPNYDRRRPLEGYLFSIAAHKLTDHLRREGRRPTLPLEGQGGQFSEREARQPAAPAAAASSVARGGERRALEAAALALAIEEYCAAQIARRMAKADLLGVAVFAIVAQPGRGGSARNDRGVRGGAEVRIHRPAAVAAPAPKLAGGRVPGTGRRINQNLCVVESAPTPATALPQA